MKTQSVLDKDIGTQDLSPMDRRIESPKLTVPRVAAFVTVAAIMVLAFFAFDKLQDGSRSYSVNAERMTLSDVRRGTFFDDVPVRGQITPITTVYLDAIEGGQVIEVLVEEGAFVEVGDPLVTLNNTDLQLEVLGREAQVTEQLNNLRNTSLALEQNRLAHKRDIIETDYQIVRVTRLLDSQIPLLASAAVPRRKVEELKDELSYLKQRRAVTLEAQTQDEKFRSNQVDQLEESIQSLRNNLVIARENLASLVIRAPIKGQLTSLDAHVGESKTPGRRLGQIDQVDRYKITVWIDEFYVTRVTLGQTGTFRLNKEPYSLKVTKVYPEVVNGQFKADLDFGKDQPSGLRRGQTVQIRLALNAPTESLLFDNGTFFQETGGAWVFVVDAATGEAVRRPVKLGRRTTRQIEVLEGLVEGDQVVTSSYETFAEMDRLTFDG